MSITDVFGESLKKARNKAGLNQEELGEIVDVDWKHISRLECGDRFISGETLDRIVEALQVEPAQLFGQPEAEELLQVICFIECSQDAIHASQLKPMNVLQDTDYTAMDQQNR